MHPSSSIQFFSKINHYFHLVVLKKINKSELYLFSKPSHASCFRFAEKSHLNRHCSFHSEERPFKCDICGKMYKTERCLKVRKTNLNQNLHWPSIYSQVHLMTHKAERPCKCKVCGKGFLSNNKLKVYKFSNLKMKLLLINLFDLAATLQHPHWRPTVQLQVLWAHIYKLS